MRWLGLGVLLWAATAGAHDFEALRLEVDVGPARVAGVLLVPSAQVEGRAPRVDVPGCEGSQSARLEARMLRVVFDLACAAPPTRLVLDDLPPGAPVLASVRHGGEATVAVLDAAAPTLALGDPGGWLRFVPIGAAHILEGADHLLFVLAFVLLVSRLRRLAGALTGFTLGHSLTLGAATLGLVQVPPALAEALIALSVLVLAAEVARPRETWTRRHPGVVAAAFGLLHGLGFAGALSALLPPGAGVVGALLGFNLGVELGQLAFVAALLGLRRLLPAAVAARARPVGVLAMGSLAGFWLWARVAAFWAV